MLQAHQLGPIECSFDRIKVLHEFERLSPQVSYSSIVRGSFQKPEFHNIRTNILEELSDIGNSILTPIDQADENATEP
jgi:ATP-dependent RNA circularization protein (DNA/RNA ligase family)